MAKKSKVRDTPSSEPKPKSDVYTGMLVISLLAMIGGCALLYYDTQSYGPNAPPAVPKPELPGAKAGPPSTNPAPAPAPGPGPG